MKLGLDELSEIYDEQLFFELTPDDQKRASVHVQKQHYPNDSAYWNAYLNWLCLDKFIAYIDEEPDLAKVPIIWPDRHDLPLIWSVVNGSVLLLGETRVVLVPVQEWDVTEFRVQREWIDVPKWAGHHFIAMQVSVQEGWIQVWGFSSHRQFRAIGRHDPLDETYSLPIESITEDLTSLWIAEELTATPELGTISAPERSPSEATTLLNKQAQSSNYSPRLDYPFEQWSAIIADDQALRSLYANRLSAQATDDIAEPPILPSVSDLGRWFRQGFESGWQAFEDVFSVNSANMAYAFRQPQASTRDIAVEGVRLIDLGLQLGSQSVALVVGITPVEQDRMGVQVQLLPTNDQNYLPAGIKLTLLSQAGKALQASVARHQDNLIRLKRFSCVEGKGFRVQISLGEFSLIESFAISPAA